MRGKVAGIVAGVALAASLTACGGSPGSNTPKSGNEALSGLKSAVQSYSDAFLTGDTQTAYATLSQRCKGQVDEATFEGIASAAKERYGSKLPIQSFDAKISDDMARVTYTYAVSAINQTDQPWTKEDGSWHFDAC